MILDAFLAVALAATGAPPEKPMSFFDLNVRTLSGDAKSLADYKGKVVLVVNTASECGFTPQYAGLEKLWKEYRDKGVVVLGFPSNDFGGQEPGTAEEIRTFCEKKYAVTFPMFEKVVTKGAGQSPVYAFLTASQGEPKWNFHKYLVGRDGRVRASFGSRTTPESDELRAAIESALK
ncbi:MAG TPA: glutathione peroxidase [Candidatus Polarisedimenticolaceae bacterium]